MRIHVLLYLWYEIALTKGVYRMADGIVVSRYRGYLPIYWVSLRGSTLAAVDERIRLSCWGGFLSQAVHNSVTRP